MTQSLSSHSYKNLRRNQRKVVSETVFAEGMTVSNNPLPLGQCRLLVNVITKDRGERVRPRGAWQVIQDNIDISHFFYDRVGRVVHHVGTAFVKNHDGTVDLRRYAFIAPHHGSNLVYCGNVPGVLNAINAFVLVEEPYVRPEHAHQLPDPDDPVFMGSLKRASYSGTARFVRKYDDHDLIKIHDMLIREPKAPGFFGTINGNTYLLGETSLLRLEINKLNTGAYTFSLIVVPPYVVTPSQAINYGYNMLAATPYNFPNQNTGTLRLHGVLPYDPVTDALKMQAKVGEAIRFKLVYDYNPSATYRARWEIQDIYARDGITTVQTQQQSPSYTNGAPIFVDYAPPYKQFSVIVTIYNSSNLNEPVRVITLASYHLSDDAVNPNKQEPKKFDLYKSKGMITWKNRLVFWGAPQAELAIFISDTNDPTYVPFPNNVVEYPSKVIKCLIYQEDLAVVTETGIYLVSNAGNGMFTSKPVQSNLQMRVEDAHSIFTIRNMICFKSRNYYYIVVPNTRNDRGELQIAPISQPIVDLLDNFEANIKELMRDMYALDFVYDTSLDLLDYILMNYSAYPDGNRIRYVYTFAIKEGNITHAFFDAHLIYDTFLRTWTMEIVQTNGQPVVLFQSIATGYAQFLNIYDISDSWRVQWLTITENIIEDNFNISLQHFRAIQNHQLVDTGKRGLEGSVVKRLREVILEFNNVEQKDVFFNHVIYVDDEPRESLFAYNPTQNVDPSDPQYGMIFIERTHEEPEVLAGVTMLGQWSLGNSQFPSSTVVKAHLPITGKGFYPRLVLLVKGNALFELNHISWVYRDMGTKNKGGGSTTHTSTTPNDGR